MVSDIKELLTIYKCFLNYAYTYLDPSTTELEPSASQSSSDGGLVDQSSEGYFATTTTSSTTTTTSTTTPSGSQSDGTPPAKPLTPRTSERKRKATGNDSLFNINFKIHTTHGCKIKLPLSREISSFILNPTLSLPEF